MNKERFAGGVVPRPQKIRNYDWKVSGAYKPDTTLPDCYTIPEKNIPEIHDQTWTQMCVAYSLCECAEAHDKKEYGETVHYSPCWDYAREELRDGYDGEGLVAETAMDGILKVGFLNKLYFDFEKDVPEILELAKDRNDLLKVSKQNVPKAYYDINYALVDKKWDMIRQALINTELPVLIISHSFFKGGSHAIIAIGFTNKHPNGTKGKYIYFQNSWGTDYKDGGRYYIPIEKIDEIYVLSWDKPKFPFTDVKKSDWFFDSVRHAYLSGFVNGTSETDFSPYDNMIRGDMAIILMRLMEKFEISVNSFCITQQQKGEYARGISFKDSDSCKISFEDVEEDDYYCDAIKFMCANGIMNGTSDTTFEPQSAITRAEVAAILCRIVETAKKMLSLGFAKNIELICRSGMALYSDVDVKAWYQNYVYSAWSYGLMEGDGNNTFAPERAVTRAEGAAVMCRLFKIIEGLLEQLW